MRVGLLTAVATAIAIGAIAVTTGGGSSTYNVFVSSAGSNAAANCKRYTSAQTDPGGTVCLTLAKACSLAQPGDQILVRNDGNYAQQQIKNTDCPNAASSAQIVFVGQSSNTIPTRGAASDAPYLAGACTGATTGNACYGLLLETGNNQCFCGGTTLGHGDGADGPNYVTFQNIRINGTSEITGNQGTTGSGTTGVGIVFNHVSVGSVQVSGPSSWTLSNSDIGPCWNGADTWGSAKTCLNENSSDFSMGGSPPGGRNQESGTFTNDVFHDYHNVTSADHSECFFALDWRVLTIQQSQFYNCQISGGIRVERASAPGASDLLTIQNNWFGTTIGQDGGTPRCGNVMWGDAGAKVGRVLIRYNTFADNTGPMAAGSQGANGTPDSTFRIVGNLISVDPTNSGNAADSNCESTPPNANYGSATVTGNVWIGTNQGTSSGNVASTAAFNALLTNSSGGATGDYHLANTTNPPNNFVTCTSGDSLLTTDYDGGSRSSPCDAGADEH